jgi:DNA-binding NtrC family response regulator
LFEIADGGTLFLDEIGEIPLALQVKLLRAIEEKQIRPVGDIVTQPINARIIAATNADLQRAVTEGRFREDLYFRLNVVRIDLPPLRERIDDIPLLANHFFERACIAHKRTLTSIHPDAMGVLLRSQWNGNVRELQNTIERAVVLCAGDAIMPDDLSVPTAWSTGKHGMTLADYERHIIESTLEEMGGNRTRTAERLGVSLRWLQYRLKEWSHE